MSEEDTGLLRFKCPTCKKVYPYQNSYFDGVGGKYCSKECSKKGSKSINDFA